MSAFVVDRADIRVLVTAATRATCQHETFTWVWNYDHETGKHDRAELPRSDHARETEVGQMLWEENITSVLYRYEGDTRETMPGPINEDFVYEHVDWLACGTELTPGQVFRVISSYEYQSCEHPGWETSEAKAFCESLRHAWCRRVTEAEEEEEAERLQKLLA